MEPEEEWIDYPAISKELDAMTSQQRFNIVASFLKRNPGNAWGWMRLAYEAEDLNRLDDALKYLQRSVEIDPSGRNVEIAYYHLALLQEGKLNDMINARLNYMNAIAANPDYQDAYHNLGLLLYTRFEDYAAAEKYFIQGLKRFPDDSGMHHNLGCVYADGMSNYLKAKFHMERALELDPGNEDTLYDLGIINEELQKSK